MMDDKLKSFVNNIGVLCETWTLTYNKFIGQGFTPKDAITHTQGFMTALITASMQNTGGK